MENPLPKCVKPIFAMSVITATNQYCQDPQPAMVRSPPPPIFWIATGYKDRPMHKTTVPDTSGGKYGSMYFSP